jgi:hypothetical protein
MVSGHDGKLNGPLGYALFSSIYHDTTESVRSFSTLYRDTTGFAWSCFTLTVIRLGSLVINTRNYLGMIFYSCEFSVYHIVAVGVSVSLIGLQPYFSVFETQFISQFSLCSKIHSTLPNYNLTSYFLLELSTKTPK